MLHRSRQLTFRFELELVLIRVKSGAGGEFGKVRDQLSFSLELLRLCVQNTRTHICCNRKVIGSAMLVAAFFGLVRTFEPNFDVGQPDPGPLREFALIPNVEVARLRHVVGRVKVGARI